MHFYSRLTPAGGAPQALMEAKRRESVKNVEMGEARAFAEYNQKVVTKRQEEQAKADKGEHRTASHLQSHDRHGHRVGAQRSCYDANTPRTRTLSRIT